MVLRGERFGEGEREIDIEMSREGERERRAVGERGLGERVRPRSVMAFLIGGKKRGTQLRRE